MYRALIIFGPPGSGKGTMGKVICELGKIFHLSSGDMFRGLDPETEIGKEILPILTQGKLVSDALTVKLLKSHIDSCIASGKYLGGKEWIMLDGVPRTVAQTVLLRDFVDVELVINLQVPNNEVLINRIAGRARVEGRSDDVDKSVLAERFRIYETETALVLKEYSKEKVLNINADQPPLMVLKDILNALTPHLN
jgi:adenylate kinase